MEVLSPLQPRAVFHYFEELCAIPHGSGNTKAVSDWCAAFAKARGLEYHQDALNNIIIIKEAAPGYEGAEPVILQGHLDMVCEKEPGCPKDLEREGLDLEVDGDFVTARGPPWGRRRHRRGNGPGPAGRPRHPPPPPGGGPHRGRGGGHAGGGRPGRVPCGAGPSSIWTRRRRGCSPSAAPGETGLSVFFL